MLRCLRACGHGRWLPLDRIISLDDSGRERHLSVLSNWSRLLLVSMRVERLGCLHVSAHSVRESDHLVIVLRIVQLRPAHTYHTRGVVDKLSGRWSRELLLRS